MEVFNMGKNVVNVKFRVTSYEGDSEFDMLPTQALAYMRQMETEQNKWLFIGKDVKSAKLMTEKDSAILDEIPFKIINGENYNINNFIITL
jgi:hypothetical protein